MIIFKKEISDYYLQPFADMYNDLKKIHKTEYKNEEIVITAFGWTNENIWRHFFRIVNAIDIPTYFIRVQTNNPDTKRIVLKQCKTYVPHDNVVNVNIVLKPLETTSNINNKFDIGKNFCINPFNNLEVTVEGEIGVCCEIKAPKELPRKVNIKDIENFTDAKNSAHVKQIQQDFLQGKKCDYCKQCWDSERAGFPSKRQRDMEFFKDLIYTTDFHNENKIRTLDLKLGITCNLKCRICSHHCSSSWYQENKRYDQVPSIESLDYGYTLSRKTWANVVKDLPDLKTINYAGGEPFLDRTHLLKLQSLLELGKTDVHIHYNTNGTQYSEQHIEVLNGFDEVSITFSIDNIGKRFDYERHGSSWEIVDKTLKRYALLDRNRYRLEFFPTVSVFNVLDLETITDYCSELGFEISYGFVDTPKEFSLYNVPPSQRYKIVEYLNASKYEKIRTVAGRFTKQDVYHNQREKFWENVNRIDLRRNENFSATYPEMYEIMYAT